MRCRLAGLALLACAGCAANGHEPQRLACADAGCSEVGPWDGPPPPDSEQRQDRAADGPVADAVDHYGYILDVPYHDQRSETPPPWNPDTSCGPTALLMLLDDLGLESALTPVLQHAAAIPLAEGGYDPACSATGNPVCTSPGALARIAEEQYGLRVEARDDWRLDEVRAALQRARPVIADIGGARGHFVVLTGIAHDADGVRVTYSDPIRGAGMVTSWERFAGYWDGPVDVDDPLQPEGHAFWGMIAHP